MGWNYDTVCENCKAKIHISERSMGVPGGKEKEQADCPACGHLVAEHMTDGFIDATVINEKKQAE
jgi:hypothetical protein